MELAEFIRKSLVDIATGVKTANEELGKLPGGLNPFYLTTGGKGEGAVAFDVAVTVTNAEVGGAGAGIQVAVFSANVGGKETSTHEHASRLRFEIFPSNSIRL